MIAQHWRGELPVLPALLLASGVAVIAVAPFALARSFTPMAESPVLWARLTLALHLVTIAVLVWWARGLYRAGRQDEGAVGRGLGKLLGLGGLAIAGWFALGLVVSHGHAVFRLAAGRTQSPAFRVLALPDRIVFNGDFDVGATATLERALAKNPAIRLVEFDSRGGYSIEGLATARAIERVGADTLVTHLCASACVTAFAGGTRRFVAPKARIGLHSSGGVDDQVLIRRTNTDHIVYMLSRGIDYGLVTRGAQTSFDDIWFPTTATVLASHLATASWNDALAPPGSPQR